MALAVECRVVRNNSKGLLLSLFNMLGWTTATQAAPSKRLPILKDLVMSNDAGRRALGLEMCQQWLKTEDTSQDSRRRESGTETNYRILASEDIR